MSTVQVDLPEDLLRAASVLPDESGDLSAATASREVAKLLALELYREGAVSLGRASELCSVSQPEFLQFAAEREVPLNYTFDDHEDDRRFIENLPS
ncbi:MAG: UPF0175 family protein [Acidobacteria bacterium]|nr:UPF0175 family protein [Acidobacteriota bacterium]MCW5968291.1 UPF0175 family protein [Blastocatellales bacterium]